MRSETLPQIISIKTACEVLDVSRMTINRYIKNGDLEAKKLGKKKNSPVRIVKLSIVEFLNRKAC